MTLLQIAFYMFAAGACGGVSFTILTALKRPYPRWFAAGHGLLGLSALLLLAYAVFLAAQPVPPQATGALAVLAAALLGGELLFRLMSPRRGRVWLAIGHGSLALVGLYLLYRAAF